MSIHSNNQEIIKRLKRADGHLRTVIAMMEEGRPCMEIAQQLHAVAGAISNAQVVFLETHIDDCLQNSLQNPEAAQQVLKDLRTIAKYLKG